MKISFAAFATSPNHCSASYTSYTFWSFTLEQILISQSNRNRPDVMAQRAGGPGGHELQQNHGGGGPQNQGWGGQQQGYKPNQNMNYG
jgi:hypothetical protein